LIPHRRKVVGVSILGIRVGIRRGRIRECPRDEVLCKFEVVVDTDVFIQVSRLLNFIFARANSLFHRQIDEPSRKAKTYGFNDIPPHQLSLQTALRMPRDSLGRSEMLFIERWSVLLTPTLTLSEWTWSKIVHLATRHFIYSPRMVFVIASTSCRLGDQDIHYTSRPLEILKRSS